MSWKDEYYVAVVGTCPSCDATVTSLIKVKDLLDYRVAEMETLPVGVCLVCDKVTQMLPMQRAKELEEFAQRTERRAEEVRSKARDIAEYHTREALKDLVRHGFGASKRVDQLIMDFVEALGG